MAPEQITELHNRVIKGITGRMIIGALGFLVPFIYYCSQYIQNQHIQGATLEKMSIQLDTLASRQMRNEIQIHEMRHDIDTRPSLMQVQERPDKTMLVTEKWVNGKLTFVPVK